MARRWDSLPIELLIAIFQFLKPLDIIRGASLCCKKWYQASTDKNCWTVLNFRDYIPSPDDSERVKAMKFFNILQFCINRAQRSVLELHFPKSMTQEEEEFCYIASRCHKLTYFSITIGRMMDLNQEQRVSNAIGRLKDLERMDVDAAFLCGVVINNEIQFLNNGLLSSINDLCPKFKNLKVRDLRVTDVYAQIICTLSRLEILDLSGSIFTTWNPVDIILTGCNQLKSLNISNSSGQLTGFLDMFRKATSQLEIFVCDDLTSLP